MSESTHSYDDEAKQQIGWFMMHCGSTREEALAIIKMLANQTQGENMESQQGYSLIGFFDSPDQTEPAYDPPHDASCIVCGEPVCLPVKTISLMWEDRADSRSYFYRTHKACYEHNSQAADDAAWVLIGGMVS